MHLQAGSCQCGLLRDSRPRFAGIIVGLQYRCFPRFSECSISSIVYLILKYMNDHNKSTGTPLGADASGKASLPPATCSHALTSCPAQVPKIPGNFGLIDHDTPKDAYTIKSRRDGREFQLVFSDEFEQDGRSFYPGDDPYWEAVDFHYWVRLSPPL